MESLRMFLDLPNAPAFVPRRANGTEKEHTIRIALPAVERDLGPRTAVGATSLQVFGEVSSRSNIRLVHGGMRIGETV